MALLKTVTHSSRVHDLCFCKCGGDGDKEFLLVAGEDKKVIIYDIAGGDDTTLPIVGALVGHQNRHVALERGSFCMHLFQSFRVRAVNIITVALPSSTPLAPTSSTTLACTISSDGWLRTFDLAPVLSSKLDSTIELQSIAEYDTKGSRLTCMTLADGELVDDKQQVINGKRKHVDEDDADEDQKDAAGDAWSGFDNEEDSSEEGDV